MENATWQERKVARIHTYISKLEKRHSDENYSQRAAISLGRSAPNLPNRLVLASRSKGEWLRMELKAKGYTAGGKPVM